MAALKPRAAAGAPAKGKLVVIKLPKTLAACADRLYACKAERLVAQKVVDRLEQEEKALKEHLINMLPKGEASGIAGKVAQAHVTRRPVYQAQDWTKIQTYIKKNGAFDLLQRRLNQEAVDERFAAKKKIPGIEVFNAVSVSCTKL